ncbi:hypothetical protein [Pseudomonas lopnurensis]|uniref:hypothetical protein n=1 Tax=Pseudomonas lopnurensis TaxID=1477517 RepID=UPI0028AE5997|nr:hypothetical protein [Pseudomonas lopnurensis]
MSIDYVKVLNSLSYDYTVIGRSEVSAAQFKEKTDVDPFCGGIERFLKLKPDLPDAAIVSVGVEQLAPVAKTLIHYGVKRILLEKPGGISSIELSDLFEAAISHEAEVYIAYNRRHYASVRAVRRFIEEDGGVSSFNFEITEWSHIIQGHNKDALTMHSWFLGNTSHVIDTAFFMCGEPETISSYCSGGLSWHPASSNYAGAGVSKTGALFAYHGNWQAPGRWSIEVLTKKRKYIFRPMEKLHVQELGSVAIQPLDVEEANLDFDFKPGLHRQVRCFIEGDVQDFCTLEHQIELVRIYERMAGYCK